MKLYGIGNVAKAEIDSVLSSAEQKRYAGNLTELSSLYKYKKIKEHFGFAEEIAVRRAYSSLPKSVIDKLDVADMITLIEWKIGRN